MAHRSSFCSSSEILDLEEEELNSLEHYKGIHHKKSDLRTDGKDGRSLNSNLGRVSSLEDDLNQLFGIFNRHNSSQGMVHSPRIFVPSKRNSSKKPVGASSSSAYDLEVSERSSLKKAFRGLCISQASQLASVKRSAKSGGSSKAGQVMTLYKNSSVEDSSSVASQYEDREGLLEISFIPEEPSPSSNGARASSKLTERVIESYESRSEMPKLEALPPERIPLAVFSPNARDSIVNVRHDTLIPTEPEGPSSLAEISRDQMLYSFSVSSSPIPDDNLLRTAKVSPIDTPMFSASSECPSRDCLTEMTLMYEHGPLPSASRSSDAKNNRETGKPVFTRVETILASPNRISGTREPANFCHTPYKPANKGSAAKSTKLEEKGSASKGGRKVDLQTVPSVGLVKGNHVKKPTKSVSRLVKPVIKTKNFMKRKSKKDASSARSPKDTRSEFNNVLYPGSNHIVCPRCNCILNDEWEEVEEESPFSPGANPGAELSPLYPVMRTSAELSPLSAVISPCAEMSPDNVFSDISTPTYNPNITNKSKEAAKGRGDLKSRDTEEFTQSSKDSPDECRSSTSISQESSLGRLGSWDRPHMSKDVRWKAIRQVRMQHGIVSLKHFNLLKKLGCGDIGTVYLAELIDTNCLFAIKVMDNEFLARRKKIGRAQTEREILRELDHPFLPTLYSQFTSDNLSCLVMEYCPGGDLHVLRQMQPGRCFTEQATRFYVAEVLLALEYLHMLGIIYRDLKPENILVREDGHIMLSDFDLSLRCAVKPTLLISPSSSDYSKSMSGPFKHSRCVEPFCVKKPSCQVSCFSPRILRRPNKPQKLKHEPTDLLRLLPQLIAEPTDARSNSFVGTHEYLAPEIIKGEGHGSAVDWWTLGIFLYELLYGRTPFRGSGNEETLANVVRHNLKFPDSPPVSLQAKDLMAGLLVKDPESRLGSEKGAVEVKQHPFFEGLNWALIRCAVPPELPELQRINGVGKGSLNEMLNSGININNNKYLEYNPSSADHLEFEVF